MNVLAAGAVIVTAMGAAKMIDRLSGEGFGREAGPGDDDLAVFICVSGVGGLETGHFIKERLVW